MCELCSHCGSFEHFNREIKTSKDEYFDVFALVILAVRLMTWLKVFKGEGDRGFVGILGLSHGALVLGLTCSWSGTSFLGQLHEIGYEVVVS